LKTAIRNEEKRMLGSHAARKAVEEGRSAALSGMESFDNPYSFITEPLLAYAWEAGFKNP
jgi:hypothetical protein